MKDTFGLAEQAKIEGLDVKAYFSCVATAFQGFSQKFGPAAENVLGAGGMVDTPEVHDYFKRHKEVTGVDADYWGNAFYYAMLEILAQSIEAVGSVDREAITTTSQGSCVQNFSRRTLHARSDSRQGLHRRAVAGRLLQGGIRRSDSLTTRR